MGDSSKKPPLKDRATILYALGYVLHLEKALSLLSEKTGININQQELEARVQESYDNGDILYFEYENGETPQRVDAFSENTASFAIASGYQAADSDEPLYLQYNRGPMGWKGIYVQTETRIIASLQIYRIGAFTFQNYAKANEFISDLESQLLPGELWKYEEKTRPGFRKKTQFNILESYLGAILNALIEGDKDKTDLNYGKLRRSKDNKYILFNTGLLSRYATDIILVGENYNPGQSSNVTINNPSILTRAREELVKKGFSAEDKNVGMVSFFRDVSEIVFDATIEVDTDNLEKLEHCIDDGIKRGRFPEEYEKLYQEGRLPEVTDRFKQAISSAVRIAKRNYKYVVPQYRGSAASRESSIQFLMPIYLPPAQYDKNPDCILVLSLAKINDEKFYIPETVLELPWAYNNARVICRPDNTWLDPARIKDPD